MTPFGEKLRDLRARRGILQRELAAALEISPAYLSALEHGKRGTPSAGLIHQICAYFGLIWDEADELKSLARLSRPRVKFNAAGLTAAQTALGNRIARDLRHLDPATVAALSRILDEAAVSPPARPRPAKTPAKAASAARES
jgi:transcriptional regulator with XRE-family HTH domain